MAKTPRDYQTECLDALAKARQEGKEKTLIVMASGLGKTLTAAFELKELFKEVPNAQVLVLCHSIDILEQIKNVFKEEFGDEYSYGMYNYFRKTAHKTNFLFANLQSIGMHRDEFSPDEFDYVIVDEAHHAQAYTYREAITYFKPRFLLGLTATPERMDGLDIEDVFDETVYKYTLYEAVYDGWLANIKHVIELDDLEERLDELTALSDSGETLSMARLNRDFFVPKRDEAIVQIIKKEIAVKTDPTTVIFCQTVEHAERFAELMDTIAVHSRLPKDKRDERLEAFRIGLIKTICAVDILNEGIDVPSIDVVVFLRITQSARIFLQQLGRGLRPVNGKKEVLVLDFVGNAERIEQIMQIRDEFERVAKAHARKTSGAVKEAYRLNIATSKFVEKRVDVLSIIQRAQESVTTARKLNTSNMSPDQMIKLLKEKGDSLGRAPTVEDINLDQSMPTIFTYRKIFGSFSEALKLAELPLDNMRREVYTREEMLEALRQGAAKSGKTPTKRMLLARDSGMPSLAALKREFGSLSGAMIAAGLSPNNPAAKLSDAELLEQLRQKAARLGRTPTIKEVDKDSGMRSAQTYKNRFGSFLKAISMAGLKPAEKRRASKKNRDH